MLSPSPAACASPASYPFPGRFIVLEGIDGAGTTTQRERLATWLRSLGHRVHCTAEPTGNPVGKLIRSEIDKWSAVVKRAGIKLE